MTAAVNAGEPAPLAEGTSAVTLADGTTFCLSDSTGDISVGGALGLFFADARILSRWQLLLDGRSPQPLSVLTNEAYAARFVLRRPALAGRVDSALLLIRDRTVGGGLREVITVRNVGREATAVTVALLIEADFADLFTVKDGRMGTGTGSHIAEAGADLVLTADDGTRGARVSASNDPIAHPGGMSWRLVIPPREQWCTEVTVQPTLGHRLIQPRSHRSPRAAPPAPSTNMPHRGADAEQTEFWVDDRASRQVLRRSEYDLAALRVIEPGGKSYVASGSPWFMTLFGRDSLLTAWMALPLDVGLAIGTLRALADRQGTNDDPLTEEQPGRILHQLRGPQDSAEDTSHYYGTIDATALFVMLLAEAWRWGAGDAVVQSLLPAADAALAWQQRHGDRDGDGFVEYARATDRGLINQGWKDSFDAINDATGRVAEPPIALCEVQGYAYAALLARADLAQAYGDADTAATCRARADQLRAAFADRFWLPERGWIALALDGGKRPVDALTSNVGHCLWTGIVTDQHAAALIDRLGADDMDTGYGLRTLAATMGAYNPMSYHNGSVWPHDTAIAIAGLMRYRHLPGAVDLAHRLAGGLLDAAIGFNYRLPELYCGFGRDEFSPPLPYPTSCAPQAWASGAPLLLVRAFLGLDPDVPGRRLTLRPALPARWQELRLDGLHLGTAQVSIAASPARTEVTGVPDGWTLDRA